MLTVLAEFKPLKWTVQTFESEYSPGKYEERTKGQNEPSK